MSRAASAISEAAARAGLVYHGKGDKTLRSGFTPLPQIRSSSSLTHVCEGALGARPILVFQASYAVYTGQGTFPVEHTVYACAGPPWPPTHVTPRNVLSRIAARLGRSPGLVLENQSFNVRFKVRATDEDFAVALLSPRMQQFMLTHTGVRWHIWPGRVCMVYGGSLKAPRLASSLERFSRFWELVPEELEAW